MRKWFPLCLLAMVAMAATFDVSGCGFFSHKKSSEEATDVKPTGPEPNVTFKGLDGKDVSLESLKGKVVVVNFWATWCEPCQIEIPWMIGFQKKYADKGFTVLGVAMDDEGASVVAPYVQKEQFDVDGQKMSMNYPIVIGDDDLASKFGGIFGLPTSVIISRDGQISKRVLGLVNHDDLEKIIQKLL
ncbi:MAG: TlpA disulfide reductase family protein [Candidatus Acidiferrales bacterium]